MDREFAGARDYAFRILATCPRTEKEIIVKLKQKGFMDDVIAEVIKLLKKYNYINDNEFAGIWVKNRCRLKPMGKRRLSQELHKKGVAKEVIETELHLLTPEMEYDMAKSIVEGKFAKGKPDLRRLYSFLLRRGFSPEVIKKIFWELGESISADSM